MAAADASVDVDMLAHEFAEGTNNAERGTSPDLEFIAISTTGAKRGIDPVSIDMQFDAPLTLSNGVPSTSFSALGTVLHEKAVNRNSLAVIVPPAQNRWEYKVFQEDDEVVEVLEEYDDAGFIEYLVLFSDGSEEVVSVPLVSQRPHPSFSIHFFLASLTPAIKSYASLLLHRYLYLYPYSTLSSKAMVYVPFLGNLP